VLLRASVWSPHCHGLGHCLKALPKTRHALFSDPIGPLAFDIRDQLSSRGDLVSPTICDHHEGRTPVGRVGLASNVAARLQGIHEITHRLVGHLSPLRKDADPCSSSFDVLEDGGVRGTQIVKTLGGKPFE
jgi:hypothetical protein